MHEDVQLRGVPRYSMVLVVTQHDLPKPYPDRGRTMMPPALKFSLNGFQLRDHPLLRRDPPNDEWSSGQVSTKVGETQESEGLRFSFATLLPVSGSVSPELDQPSLARVQFQAELREAFLKIH